MGFIEDRQVSAPYRDAYRNGIAELVRARRAEADAVRRSYVSPERMAADQETYRRDLSELLGWPLTQKRGGVPAVTVCAEREYEPGITMRRLQIEALPGVPFYGILFVPGLPGPKPLVISQHGGGATPEQTADMHRPNKYKDMTARLARAGCVVFAPQLLMWQVNDNDIPGKPGYGMDPMRSRRENELRHLGGGIVPVELYELMRSIDALSALPDVDADRIGMIGASYGGLYTQMLAALDTRVKAAVSVAYYNDRYAYCWGDFSWKGAALKMKDPEICGLIAPRALCIHVGRNDGVFDVASALPEIEKLRPYYAAWGAEDRLKVIVSDVDHTLTDDGAEIRFLLDSLGAQDR